MARLDHSVAVRAALAGGLYLLGAALLFPHYSFLWVEDEIAYVAIAGRYAAGDIMRALNSYWGPLPSLVLTPFLAMGVRAAVATRLIDVAWGVGVLLAVERLGHALRLPSGLRLLTLLGAVPLALYFAMFFYGADLALTCLLVGYFARVIDPAYSRSRWAGLWCGILGGTAFLAKAYALPFFLAHFTLCNAVYWLRAPQDRRAVMRNAALGLAACGVIAGAWIGALYVKYDQLTIGFTGQYNHDLIGPDSRGAPLQEMGFVKPSPDATTAIWEDPRALYQAPRVRECCLKSWSALHSAREFRHQVHVFRENLHRTREIYGLYTPATWLILAAAGVAWLVPGISGQTRTRLSLVLLTLGLFPLPYALIFSDDRYLWSMLLVMLVLGAHLLDLPKVGRPWVRVALAAALVLAFVPYPVQRLQWMADSGKAIEIFADRLKDTPVAGARVASNVEYGRGMSLAYLLGATYYGQARLHASPQQIAQDLHDAGVDYYLALDSPVPDPPGLKPFRYIDAAGRKLTVYAVR